MTDAAEVLDNAACWCGCAYPDQVLDALLSLAPDAYPRRVVLEQEAEGEPVKVRLLELPPADLMLMAERLGAMVGYRLIDPEATP